jgi:two-component system, OmpR family, sensor histidine kinase PhoQ
LASAVLLPLLLGFSGTMLNHAYQRSLQSAERDSLQHQIYILLGAAEPSSKGLQLPPELMEPRYSSINSGLMGWVVNTKGKLQWRSPSSDLIPEDKIPKLSQNFSSGQVNFFNVWVDDQEYYAVSYDTIWDVRNKEKGFRFLVLQSREPVINELKAYQKRLWRWIAGLGFLLILVQTLIAKWGLSPLPRLAMDLENVEKGLQTQLSGAYPAEIQPVTDNLNRVLRIEQAQRERYRNTLSDLAHSLKTPLAVIRGHLEGRQTLTTECFSQLIEEQVSRMSAIVDHQLRRANAQVTQATTNKAVEVRTVIERLVRAMSKVYQAKHIHATTEIAGNLMFHGDEADLLELIGNIIDNAYKYGNRAVSILAARLGRNIEICIEDDGPGITPEIQHSILTRGTRADTATPGQGIGLAVAVDILSSYGGSVEIFRAKLGGAGFKITIPN